MTNEGKITGETVRADFNHPLAVIHYARAANFLGLWASERILIERFFSRRKARLLEAGCGAGRVTLGLWHLGYGNLTAFDIAEEPLDQARSLAAGSGAAAIRFLLADATALPGGPSPAPEGDADSRCPGDDGKTLEAHSGETFGGFDGALFMFNGLMQIPGRRNRRSALRELRRVCRDGSPLLFTTHDRDATPAERALWSEEAGRWARGEQNPRLVEFGDRYFSDDTGATFMHLPDRGEILDDLAATGWDHGFDAMRREIAAESAAVRDFSDECRFWMARARPAQISLCPAGNPLSAWPPCPPLFSP